MRHAQLSKLPVRPFPVQGEGVNWYLLRLATSNGLDGIGYRLVSGKRPTEKEVNALLGRSDREFWKNHPEHCIWFGYKSKRNIIWNTQNRKLCPECLREKRYGYVDWELNCITTCSIHGIKLIDTCPQCHNPIGWKSPELTHCECGYNLSAANAEQSTESDISLTKAFRASMGFGNFPEKLTYLSHLTTYELILLTQYLGKLDSTTEKQVRTTERRLEILAPAFSRAANFVCNWPESFQQHLSKLHKKTPQEINPASVSQVFGKTYTRLYIGLKSEKYKFVRTEFERFIQNNWQWPLCSRNNRLSKLRPEKVKWLPAAQAAKQLQVRSSYIKQKVLLGEMLGHSFTSPNGRTDVVVPADELERMKSSVNDFVNLLEASEILRITDKRVIELVDEQIVVPISRPDPNNLGRWKFHRVSLQNLLDHVKDVPVHDEHGNLDCISLSRLLIACKKGGKSFPNLISAIINRELTVAALQSNTPGLPGWLIERLTYLKWLGRNAETEFDGYSVQQIASILEIKEEVAYKLVKKKLINSQKVYRNGRLTSMVTEDNLNQFRHRFVFNSHLAKELKTLPRYLLARFADRNLYPYLRIEKEKFRQAIFERTLQFEQSWETISAILIERRMNTENNSPKAMQNRIIEIGKVAKEVFGSSAKARRWLRLNNIALGGTPVSMLDTETGKKEVLKVLGSIASGGAV
jgi:hypothetical protein